MNHRILIANDDGINAPGLAVMERIARTVTDDVWVVAPDFERSGASRSVSLADPIRINQIDEKRFALLRGTPTDCIVMAFDQLMTDAWPTLVLSGVNRGSNLAEDMTYSGTVAAAMEAAQYGVRSIAMSQGFPLGGDVRWQTAEVWGPRVVESLLALETPPGVFHNVNFPDVDPDQVRGVRSARQGRWGSIKLNVDVRTDARRFPYSWLSFVHETGAPEPGTDLEAAHSGWVSVTPLHSDITWHSGLAALALHLGTDSA
ncbi:MAG: 5'/3'-nucleotidase SurE [Betaproteobacteria bacterium]